MKGLPFLMSPDNYAPVYEAQPSSLNPLSVLVAPLAALALVGAAAAVATNPVLLTVATLSSGRKRRALSGGADALVPEIENKLHEMEVLEKYIAAAPEHEKQQEKLMASYLSCSGFTESQNACMDRVVCEFSVQPSSMSDLEKDVITM